MSIGWAIISTSGYADTRAAPAINQAQGAELVAVCSRDQDRGEAFAQKHGAKTPTPRWRAVYITSPNLLLGAFGHASFQTAGRLNRYAPIPKNRRHERSLHGMATSAQKVFKHCSIHDNLDRSQVVISCHFSYTQW